MTPDDGGGGEVGPGGRHVGTLSYLRTPICLLGWPFMSRPGIYYMFVYEITRYYIISHHSPRCYRMWTWDEAVHLMSKLQLFSAPRPWLLWLRIIIIIYNYDSRRRGAGAWTQRPARQEPEDQGSRIKDRIKDQKDQRFPRPPSSVPSSVSSLVSSVSLSVSS